MFAFFIYFYTARPGTMFWDGIGPPLVTNQTTDRYFAPSGQSRCS